MAVLDIVAMTKDDEELILMTKQGKAPPTSAELGTIQMLPGTFGGERKEGTKLSAEQCVLHLILFHRNGKGRRQVPLTEANM